MQEEMEGAFVKCKKYKKICLVGPRVELSDSGNMRK